jgi:hypothetical protein
MRIGGSRAVVTGASGGIGRAVAVRLARLGADVALVGRRPDALELVAADARRHGTRVVVVPCDITDPADVARAYGVVATALGPPDILVNAAGFGVWKPFLEITSDEHAGMMNVMYWGAFHWIRAALPAMIAGRRGHVVNLSAGSGRVALPVTSGFSAAAFALSGMSEALHRELLGSPVGVSCVHPGSVRTGFWDQRSQPSKTIPPLVRYAPKLSAEAVARNVCYCIWLRWPTRTLPIFVAFLARANGLWVRLGDLILWKWFVPFLVAAVVVRLLLR